MAVINNRLSKWVEVHNKLTEYQAGFRSKYSTIDNIYNLSCIIQLKFSEGKKVYAFFVDFKAAFDSVPRKALLYKLSCMGVSSKLIKLLGKLYDGTESSVWNGENLSNYFETKSGVKQGCLLSPLIFALFLNDLHEELGYGINIEGTNIRLLLYADDIVILAERPDILQHMINRLENYCTNWSMVVNLTKSKIMVFRRGGRLARDENWTFQGNNVQIVSEYCYLGVTFTTRMSFVSHIEGKSKSAKACVFGAWRNLLNDEAVSVSVKMSIFRAAVRAIQTYASEVFGFEHTDQINKLQLFFIKYILRLPEFTPSYALYLETKEDPSSMSALKLHMNYVFKTLFIYDSNRLPHNLSLKIIRKNIYWFKHWKSMENILSVRWGDVPLSVQRWRYCINASLENYKFYHQQDCIIKKLSSQSRFYKQLSHQAYYIYNDLTSSQVMHIVKARCDVIWLNGNNFRGSKRCELCTSNENETLQHFIGECPALGSIRNSTFGKLKLSRIEIIDILNGHLCSWNYLAEFIQNAMNTRKMLRLPIE
jgi:hypothetical protein